MPGGDRTGPMGMGPRTGRGVGYCAGYNTSGYAEPMPGRGMGRGFVRGRGFGGGRGFGWNRPNPYAYGVSYGSGQGEAEILKGQAKAMREEMEAINARIKELESGTAQGKSE